MSVKLIFSFDSEDYETPEADDAEKWWAETMTRHGITACLCVVGELARALRDRGRQDVIAAMARHEIAYHSDMHSAHPTWAEYLETSDWEAGVARVLREEARGIADVEETFGQRPAAWCKPGASWGPQVAYAMTRMGVPVFCDAPFEAAPGQPLWYDDSLLLSYHTAFDSYFSVPHDERLDRMKTDFAARCERHEGRHLVMFTHPCRLVTSRFSDTFTGGRNPPRAQWKPAPPRPERDVRELRQDVDGFLAWVVRQPNVELTTYRALARTYRQGGAPWLSADLARQLAAAAPAFDYLRIDGTYLSPAEQFGVIVRAVAGVAERGRPADRVPVRRLLGPAASPPGTAPAGRAAWNEVAAAARWADAFCSRTRAVPAAVRLGRADVGPNTFLQAAARALSGTGAVDVLPAEEYPAITRRDDFRRQRFQNTWTEFPPDFTGENVLEMIRLQAWTAKPAVAGDEAAGGPRGC